MPSEAGLRVGIDEARLGSIGTKEALPNERVREHGRDDEGIRGRGPTSTVCRNIPCKCVSWTVGTPTKNGVSKTTDTR